MSAGGAAFPHFEPANQGIKIFVFKMESKSRTAWYTSIVVFGSAFLLFSGYVIVAYQDVVKLPSDGEEAYVAPVYDHNRNVRQRVDALSRCSSVCVFNQIVEHCAYPDYVCMCERFHLLGDPCMVLTKKQIAFRSCMEDCTLNDQWRAPGIIVDICEAVNVRVVLPDFMLPNLRLHGRQFGGSSGIFNSDSTTYTPDSTYTTTTIYTTVEPGSPETTITEYGGYTDTVIIKTSAPTGPATSPTTTSTPPAKTSTGLDSDPPPTGSSTGSKTGSDSSVSRKRGGFAPGAKIAIGVVIPLLLLLVAWIAGFFWKKRKRAQQQAAETERAGNINNQPEIAELGDRPHFPPAYHPPDANNYKHVQQEPEVHAIHNPSYGNEPAAEVAGHNEHQSQAQRYELNVPGAPRSELHDKSAQSNFIPPTELPERPAQAHSSNIGRKAISPTHTHSSVPPWDNSQGQPTYVPYSNPTEGASLPEVVSPSSSSPAPATNPETEELRLMEAEMARIQAQKQRLSAMHALEMREEELRKTIEARRTGASGA